MIALMELNRTKPLGGGLSDGAPSAAGTEVQSSTPGFLACLQAPLDVCRGRSTVLPRPD